MKRLLLVAVLVLLFSMPASGLHLDFQDSGEFVSYVTCAPFATCTWVHSTNGGNNYISTFTTSAGGVMNTDPLPMTYSAATISPGLSSFGVVLYDGSMNTLYSCNVGATAGRFEMKMVGGKAYIYRNSNLIAVSGALAQNPSYVSWGGFNSVTSTVDDIIWGSSENRYIFGSPEQGYLIKKDMINPAASGFCFPNGTIISNYNMTTTWGFGDSNESQTVILKEWSSGYTAATYATPAGSQAGSINWAIYDDIINDPTMPYGYYITTIAGSGTQSTVIPYVAMGATVAFDKASYSRGDTASVSWSVDGGGYWNTATYAYRLDMMDVYGNVISTHPVTAQAGSTTVTFADSDATGVYYAILIATPLAGGSGIWMNFDTAELTGYLVFTGSVYDAETAAVIPVANVSIVQGSVAYNKVTSADGNYTTNVAFYSGTTTTVNITASGYQRYADTFTPLAAKTIGLNFTLMNLTPTHTGIAIGGVVRDTVYGRPISLPTVSAANATFAESYSVIGNSVGYYQIDESDGAFLTSGRCYTVTGSKTGYSSTSYLKCVVET